MQIDHTVVDLIVVDERHRMPIGRPYLTAGIDVYSRSLPGLVVTLEPPSATTVGLCLSHMVTDKRVWLESLGVDERWPMSGKPAELYLDNASEFKSEALRRGCAQHGIRLSYRPVGRPHYGGIVERVIATMMELIHQVPGTTFSNPAQRGQYDSDAAACLTMGELHKWLALAVINYHAQIHSTTGATPAALWAQGVAQAGEPVTVTDATAFLVDFLPVIRRTLTRTGFVIDHVRYYSDALKPWIAARGKLDRFLIRRDPRDISRVWVLDPDGRFYLEVPYRTQAHPSLSLWEHRAAVTQLRTQGRSQIDEATLFRTVEQMRAITAAAAATTRRARRDTARRSAAPPSTQSSTPVPEPPPTQPADTPTDQPARPYADIEIW